MGSKELEFVVYCNRLGGTRLDAALRFLSSVTFLASMWSLLVALAIFKHPEIIQPFSLAVLVVAILHFAITEGLLKHALTGFFPKRKRPYVAYPERVRPIGRQFSDSSFPSSHMTTTTAMFFVLVSFYPSLMLIGLLFSSLMAFSRLHNGMHYPSDLLAGIILGLAYGWLAVYLVR